MGQYHFPVCLDLKEFICPHKLGTGLKLAEQCWNHPGTGTALVILLCSSEYRGGGDIGVDEDEVEGIVGRWAGHKVALVGDYAEDRDLPKEHEASKIYRLCSNNIWTDISDDVCKFVERICGGKYTGDGWRKFVENKRTERV